MIRNSEDLKIRIKENIGILISNNELVEAKGLIEEYKKNILNDVEMYSMEAVILIMQNKLDQAELILKEGLYLDKDNFDLNYNLAYIYEQNNKFDDAYKYYNRAFENCIDENEKNNLVSIIQKIKDKYNIIEIEEKKKIVFFVKQGMDSFLGDIIKGLSEKYETKKIIVTDYKQIDEGMHWADICWFEWCDELIAYGSKHRVAEKKKIVCRLHSYEAFTDYPKNVEWNNLYKVIFVAKNIKDFVVEKFKLDKSKTTVIANGVDIKKYTFKERNLGFNIAYVGYINYKKGPMLLLHTFKSIYDKDNRYKLYIAGEFQDDRDILYFRQMIREFGIEGNVFFEGWQDNLNQWLENKNYILCTSVLESQNMSIMQAMSKGIKPIIHNFVGAREIYPNKYIWNTIDESVEIISQKEYDSKKCRSFIENNYSMENQTNKIKGILERLDFNKNEQIFNFNYDEINIKFYLPYLNDWVQKVIYETNNFYEIGMLEDIKNRLGENKVVVDVGANIGNHTIFFSKVCKAKQVYSFEPQPNIFTILKKNVEINNVEDIVSMNNIGIGKEHTLGNIEITDENNYGMSKINKSDLGNIEINSLDNILMNKVTGVDMIKIDVEGMELEVLEGSKKILKKFTPLIYIEAGTDEEFIAVLEFLKKFRYKPIYKFNSTPTYLFIYS